MFSYLIHISKLVRTAIFHAAILKSSAPGSEVSNFYVTRLEGAKWSLFLDGKDSCLQDPEWSQI